MNPDLALDWYLGKTSNEKFSESTVGLARDPYLLFEYFIDEIGHRDKLYRIVRDEGEKWVNFVESAASQAIPLMEFAKEHNERLDLKRLMSQIASGDFWRKIVSSFAELDLINYSDTDIIRAKDKSPSTSVFVYVLTETLLVKLRAVAARVSQGNLKPLAVNVSDYADFTHAVFAPYVDVFRCDSRIGELLKRNPLTSHSVAPKRSDLLKMLTL